MSMRPDVLPAALILELRKLQDSVTAVPFAEIKAVLVGELGTEVAAVFSEFDEKPVAAASLAQVYFARLRPTGRQVAVKVQRPNIARTVQVDLEFATWFAGAVQSMLNT